MMTTRPRSLGLVVLSSMAIVFLGSAHLPAQFKNPLAPTNSLAQAKFAIELAPVTAKPGDEITLKVTATVPDPYHIYSLTQGDGGFPTQIDLKKQSGVEAIEDTFKSDREPEKTELSDLKMEFFHGKVSWTRKFKILADAKPGDVEIAGEIKYQICMISKEGGQCIPGKPVKFSAKLQSGADAEQPTNGDQVALANEKSKAGGQAAKAPVGTPYEQREKRNSGPILATWRANVQPRQAKPGDLVTLTITADLKDNWHIYSPTQKADADGDGPPKTFIKVTDFGGLKPNGPFQGSSYHSKDSAAYKGLKELQLEGTVKWTRQYQVPTDAASGEITISGGVNYQICYKTCIPHVVAFEGKLKVGTETIDEPIGLTLTRGEPGAFEDKADPVEDRESVATAEGPAPKHAEPETAQPQTADAEPASSPATAGSTDITANGFLWFMLFSIGGGFAALMTPCVFPMIPITVSVFQKQAESKHSSPLALASVYSLSIIGTFTILGMLVSIIFGPTALNAIANVWWFNVGMGLLLGVFACNMLGMFDIVMPSWLISMTANQESRGGYIGVVFMALTFTLTSFTCTFAVAGTLLSMAARGDRLWPFFGLLGFSSAFALPFFFLALFPSLLQRLPQSGGWMNAVKVVMGIIELGAGLKFLSLADVAWFGRPYLLDYQFVLTAWMVLSILSGVYLLGMFRTPHDVPIDHVGVIRLGLAISFIGLGAYIAVGLFATKPPQGWLWQNIAALAPPPIEDEITDEDLGPTFEHAGVRYALDIDRALKVAIKHNRPLFVDVTGQNCPNCRLMEQGPMSKAAIAEKLKKFVCVRFYADIVPRLSDRALSEAIFRRNQDLQAKWFTDVTMPMYMIFKPSATALESRSSIVGELPGYNIESVFEKFLDTGLSRWKSAPALAVTRNN